MVLRVVKLNRKELGKLKRKLSEMKEIQVEEPTNQWEVFRMRYKNATIVGYSSRKVVISEERALPLISKILEGMKGKRKAKYGFLIGTDEAGKGEWLGPLTIGGVALKPDEISKLRIKGVMDSKDLSMNKLIELYDFIKNSFPSSRYNTFSLPPSKFNKQLRIFRKRGKNLNHLLAWGHSKCIKGLLKQLPIGENRTRIIVDEFDRVKLANQLDSLRKQSKVTILQEKGAESHIPVAAASILARGKREKWIDRYSKKNKVDLRKLTPEAAFKRKDRDKIAKLTYLESYVKNEKRKTKK